MIKTDNVLDAKNVACPLPIIKTKKAMKDLSPGQVIEVQATDEGSTADLKAWAESSGHHYLGTVEEDEMLRHYLRKASSEEEKQEIKHPHVISNADLWKKINNNEKPTVIDVREQAEFAFHHIPGAISIPLEEIDTRLTEFNKKDELYLVCRTGNRSDLAAQKLVEKGFTNVANVIPGMSQWDNVK